MHKFIIIAISIFFNFNVAQSTVAETFDPPVIAGFPDYDFKCGIGTDPEILLIKDNKGNVGLVNEYGKVLIPLKYIDGGCRHFYVNIETPKNQKFISHNYFALKNKQGKWGLVNELNQIVIPFQYDHLDSPFFHGTSDLFLVKKNQKYGIIKINNDYVVPFDYSLIVPFEYDFIEGHKVYTSPDDYLIIQKDGKFGLLTGNAKVVIPRKYERLETIYSNDNFMKFRQNGKWGIVSIITGKVVVPAQYSKEEIDNKKDLKEIENENNIEDIEKFSLSFIFPLVTLLEEVLRVTRETVMD